MSNHDVTIDSRSGFIPDQPVVEPGDTITFWWPEQPITITVIATGVLFVGIQGSFMVEPRSTTVTVDSNAQVGCHTIQTVLPEGSEGSPGPKGHARDMGTLHTAIVRVGSGNEPEK